jgi:hypothetical protein
MTPPDSGFTVRTADGRDLCLDGLIMYSCQSIIQRDPSVFGDDANVWVPERWLGEGAKTIPASAWRPFERGPRNCIGLELANIEMRVIIAIITRKYDLCKVGVGELVRDEKGEGVEKEQGQYEVQTPLYNVSQVFRPFSLRPKLVC